MTMIILKGFIIQYDLLKKQKMMTVMKEYDDTG